MGENVAKFGVCLSQQIQILQMEYPGRIQQEHVEEVKQDCFYEDPSPEYQQMLAHKVDGEKLCYLFQVAPSFPELERQAEARDPLLLKTTTARSSNIIHSHSQRNLFPSRKLKGNCTFTAQSAVVGDCEMEEDSGPKPNDETEAESPAEEDARLTVEVSDVEPSLGYIVWFANVVELYQKKNCNCFRCGNPHHLMKNCPKELVKVTRMVGLNSKEGMVKKGGQSSQKQWLSNRPPQIMLPKHKNI